MRPDLDQLPLTFLFTKRKALFVFFYKLTKNKIYVFHVFVMPARTYPLTAHNP